MQNTVSNTLIPFPDKMTVSECGVEEQDIVVAPLREGGCRKAKDRPAWTLAPLTPARSVIQLHQRLQRDDLVQDIVLRYPT